MNELQKLRMAARQYLSQMLLMFSPAECAQLLRHMADEIELGQEIARRWKHGNANRNGQ